MATPPLDSYVRAMYDFAGITISEYIRRNINQIDIMLDVGAGWGKYRFLLPEYEMDGLDIWMPYIEQEKLDAYYRNVFVEDAYDFQPKEHYAAITMGDTLEHIPIERAQSIVKKLVECCDCLIIAVPFEMPQEEVHGNKHEAHQQEDLNQRVMEERYPELELYALSPKKPGEHQKAIYIKRGTK